MAFNGAGVRDTARTLKIGINTVIRTLKNSKPGNTGSGTRITPKQGGYWPTLLVPVPMKPAGNYWHCLRHSTSA
ncbi:Transposase [Shigella dysenteriae 1617]|uniref:Transposase n=1 Tax=Shigella dysenteriae 1617 TaxID=754093 RepID=A0A0A6ZUG2_SHIDY|nr:Transposase [Shigella dysenteriae 1617]